MRRVGRLGGGVTGTRRDSEQRQGLRLGARAEAGRGGGRMRVRIERIAGGRNRPRGARQTGTEGGARKGWRPAGPLTSLRRLVARVARPAAGDRPVRGSVPSSGPFSHAPSPSGSIRSRPVPGHAVRTVRTPEGLQGSDRARPFRRPPSGIVCRPGVPGRPSAVRLPSPRGTQRRRRKTAVHPGRSQVVVNRLWHATVRRTLAHPCGAVRVVVGAPCRRQPLNRHLIACRGLRPIGDRGAGRPGFPVVPVLPVLPGLSGRRSLAVPGVRAPVGGAEGGTRGSGAVLAYGVGVQGTRFPARTGAECPSGPGCNRPVGSRSVSSGVGSSRSPGRALPRIPLSAPRRGS